MTAAYFTRWFLALFFVGVAAFYTIRILLLKRKVGTSPVFSGTSGTVHFATHFVFRIFRVLILAVCVVRLLWPVLDRYLFIFDALWHPAILMLGDAMLLVSFSLIILFHFYMGKYWRSGVRVDDRTELVTTGPFAVSRNPMMLCVVAAQVGFFLALPSAFTFVCLVMGVWAVVSQVKVEERILRQRFGDVYDAYSERTPRWLIF